MISNIFEYDGLFYYYKQLCELAEIVGVETTCFVLDSFEKEVTKAYRKYRAILKLKKK